SRSDRLGGSHQRPFESVPITATSSAVTGKSSRVRSVWATYAGRPLTSTVPAAGSSSPSSTRNSVVFPPPFGPSTQTDSPGATSNETSSSAGGPPYPAASASTRIVLELIGGHRMPG